jgi:hypothetical protein
MPPELAEEDGVDDEVDAEEDVDDEVDESDLDEVPATDEGGDEAGDASNGEATDGDVEVAVAQVDDMDDPEGFFAGVDTAVSQSSAAGMFGDDDGDDDGETEDDTTASAEDDARLASLSERINMGCARAAVIGLEEGPAKDSLKAEFQDTFETFGLGRYGAVCAEEYLEADVDDINPIWGLVGAMLICAAVVVWRRPDIDHTRFTDRAQQRWSGSKLYAKLSQEN